MVGFGVFLFSKFGASDNGQAIIFYFRKFAHSWNEFVLTIKKQSLLILSSGKISHRGYDKKWQKYGAILMNFRRHFFRDYFLCVDDRSENEIL